MNPSDRALLKELEDSKKAQAKSDRQHTKGLVAAMVVFLVCFGLDAAYFWWASSSGALSDAGSGLRGLGYALGIELLAVGGAYRLFTRR